MFIFIALQYYYFLDCLFVGFSATATATVAVAIVIESAIIAAIIESSHS